MSVFILVSRLLTTRRPRLLHDRGPTVPTPYHQHTYTATTYDSTRPLHRQQFMITCTVTTHASTTVSPTTIPPPTTTTTLTPPIQGPTTDTRPQDRPVSGFGTTTVFHPYLPWSLTTVEWLGGASKSSTIVIGRGFRAPEPPSGIHI